jgi:hypothetical protein
VQKPSEFRSRKIGLSQQFIVDTYLPYVEKNKKPSTAKGYRNLYRGISQYVNGVSLKGFGVPAAQRLINIFD